MPYEASSTEYSPACLLPDLGDLFPAVCHLKSSGNSDHRKDFPWLSLSLSVVRGPFARTKRAARGPLPQIEWQTHSWSCHLQHLLLLSSLSQHAHASKRVAAFPKRPPFCCWTEPPHYFHISGTAKFSFLRCRPRICVLPGLEVVWFVVVGTACGGIPSCMEGSQGCWIVFPDLFGLKRLHTWAAIWPDHVFFLVEVSLSMLSRSDVM